MLVVSRETCPSQARIVLMSTPARSRCVAVVCLLYLQRHSRHYLPFRTISGSGTGLHFGSMILGLIMPSPRQSLDIVLSQPQAAQKGQKTARVVHTDRPFQSRWDCRSAADGPLGTSPEICFVVMIQLNAGSLAPTRT